ncbi:hypothetical protein SDC9_201096 [bioreactor metagenome]|uniref:Uncharacterized protein n=1 Tax=bioreactor metagenome TaxID=1076179 RepID=A0A645IRA4_9ZZZZ
MIFNTVRCENGGCTVDQIINFPVDAQVKPLASVVGNGIVFKRCQLHQMRIDSPRETE